MDSVDPVAVDRAFAPVNIDGVLAGCKTGYFADSGITRLKIFNLSSFNFPVVQQDMMDL